MDEDAGVRFGKPALPGKTTSAHAGARHPWSAPLARSRHSMFSEIIFGKGNKEERESGLLGNHVLLAQAAAQMGDVLPPSAESLSNNFVALFGRSPEQVEKCQILKVNRQAYVALVKERAQTNPVYHDVVLDNVAVTDIPEDGVPPQILACACPLVGSDRYRATRIGPGTFRDPMDKSQGDEENIGRGHGRRRAMC